LVGELSRELPLDKLENIVLASNNTGKIREFTTLLSPFHIQLIPQSELSVTEIEETGLSFVENALLKARHAAKSTGLPAIADDSGLVVAALNGKPGIYSARYAGQSATSADNIKQLLADMSDVPAEKRDAFFYCVLVFISHPNDPTPLVCEGKWSGSILFSPQGENGFGYDPIFYVPTEHCSAAELAQDKKNKLSHRGNALQSLLKLLPDKIHECAFRTESH
jgi:XTP/dITP diphosphohydrolase